MQSVWLRFPSPSSRWGFFIFEGQATEEPMLFEIILDEIHEKAQGDYEKLQELIQEELGWPPTRVANYLSRYFATGIFHFSSGGL